MNNSSVMSSSSTSLPKHVFALGGIAATSFACPAGAEGNRIASICPLFKENGYDIVSPFAENIAGAFLKHFV